MVNRLTTIKEHVETKGYAAGFVALVDYTNDLLPSNEEIGQALRATMYTTGDLALFEKMIARDTGSVAFSTVGNRRLTGSMNEMAREALIQMYYRYRAFCLKRWVIHRTVGL